MDYKNNLPALVGVAHLVPHPIHQKDTGSIPSQGMSLGCRFGTRWGHVQEATNQCFSFTVMFFSLSLSLASPRSTVNKHVLGWGQKNYQHNNQIWQNKSKRDPMHEKFRRRLLNTGASCNLRLPFTFLAWNTCCTLLHTNDCQPWTHTGVTWESFNKTLKAGPWPRPITSESWCRPDFKKQAKLSMWSSGVRVENSALRPHFVFFQSSSFLPTTRQIFFKIVSHFVRRSQDLQHPRKCSSLSMSILSPRYLQKCKEQIESSTCL